MVSPAAADASQSPYVASWCRRGAPAAVRSYLVPSPAGARLFRKCGWQGFHAAVASWAAGRGIELAAVSIVDELPCGDHAAAARPTDPEVITVVHDGSGAIVCTLRVPFDLAVFHGHFPTVPIGPGAMLLGWAAALAATHGGWSHGARQSVAMKFRRIVQPGPDYRLRLERTADGRRVDFRLESDAGVHAVGALQAPA